MKKKFIFGAIIILIILADALILYYYSNKNQEKINLLPKKYPIEEAAPVKKYDFKDIVYDFWGVVLSKEEDAFLAEGTMPDGKIESQDWPLWKINFKMTTGVKVVKIVFAEEKMEQIFITPEEIQVGDRVGIKISAIDQDKKEAQATDVFISNLPEGLKKNIKK